MLSIKAHISASKLIAGGPPNLAIITINQKNLITGWVLNTPIFNNKFREFEPR